MNDLSPIDEKALKHLTQIWVASIIHLRNIGLELSVRSVASVFTALYYCLDAKLNLTFDSFDSILWELYDFHAEQTSEGILQAEYTTIRLNYYQLMSEFSEIPLSPLSQQEDLKTLYNKSRRIIAFHRGNPPVPTSSDHEDFSYILSSLIDFFSPFTVVNDGSTSSSSHGAFHIATDAVRYAPEHIPSSPVTSIPTPKAVPSSIKSKQHTSSVKKHPSVGERKRQEIEDLERKIYELYEELDAEKGKRQKYLFITYSVFVFFVLCRMGILDAEGGFIMALILSAIFGAIITYLPIFIFAAVGDHFTNINSIQDRITSLEKELYRLKSPKGPDEL